MAGTDEINSIIAADFGSVNTRVILIDLVDGAFRLVAQGVTRTTAGDPLRDVAVGLYRALEQLSEQTGRQFLIQNRRPEMIIGEQPDGSGVDALLATASVGQPLQVVVVGLMPDVSIASAQHVLAGSYVRVVDRLSLADIRTPQQQINAILAKKPDLIFVVGGTDAGAEAPILDMVRIVRDAVRVAAKKPMVLYAGNRAVQGEVNNLLTGLWVLLFLAACHAPLLRRATAWLAAPGRMSLTIYVTQSLYGVPLFYGFGLGLYQGLGQVNALLLELEDLVRGFGYSSRLCREAGSNCRAVRK